jgi:hypothetical protein
VRARSDEIPANDVARVETRIEELAASIERCANISMASKIAITAGAAWIVLTFAGLVAFAPAPVVAALAVIIGGAVLLGSNRTTWQQMEADIRASEALRARMIEQLDLRAINGETRH